MSRVWTIEYLQELKRLGKIQGFVENFHKVQEKKRSKYGAQKTVLDGITFDSKREAKRYMELRMLQLAGEITDLQLQVPYELNPGGTHSLKYVCDFQYVDQRTGELIVEDTKGFLTREYKKKRKLMKEVHNITIREV